jgi:hypothetical protein
VHHYELAVLWEEDRKNNYIFLPLLIKAMRRHIGMVHAHGRVSVVLLLFEGSQVLLYRQWRGNGACIDLSLLEWPLIPTY